MVSSVRSAIMLFMTPMFPLSIPFKKRLAHPVRVKYSAERATHLRTRAQKERERPKRRHETEVPRRPQRSTGFRPTLSERRPHWSTVTASAAKYKDTYGYCRRTVGAPRKRVERKTKETYYKSRVVSDLFFVTTNDWEFTDKLRGVTHLITFFDGNE